MDLFGFYRERTESNEVMYYDRPLPKLTSNQIITNKQKKKPTTLIKLENIIHLHSIIGSEPEKRFDPGNRDHNLNEDQECFLIEFIWSSRL